MLEIRNISVALEYTSHAKVMPHQNLTKNDLATIPQLDPGKKHTRT